ncbi:MAG: ABC transporter permease subunit [Pseudomonadaceae bacterium]|nr:ABC transporter permease subunit [Pseudomonadaceae bacterium]
MKTCGQKSVITMFGLAWLLWVSALNSFADEPIVVGSKNFNESYLLAELMSQALEAEGFEVRRTFGLGGTLICYDALIAGEIDVYPEYTGTLSQAILELPGKPGLDVLREKVADKQLSLLEPFGFNNTYAMVVPETLAQQRNLTSIADLADADLNIVVSHEFLERGDGWPGLARAYGLDDSPGGIEHGLAYQAIAEGRIDVTDAYSTDGELQRYKLRVLTDDRAYFPTYLALPFANSTLPPAARAALASYAGRISDEKMAAMNSAVVFGGASFSEVAGQFRAELGFAEVEVNESPASDLTNNVLRHLQLTGTALGLAIVVGLLVSLLVYRRTWLARTVLYVTGLLQTIPSIALLALMIPLFGIGFLPAVVALFLYSLLPIVRNTVTALTTLDPTLVEVSRALGMTTSQRLWHVYLPLSLPSILAGVRTSAVISIGTATLAAFIGAGGLGVPIVTGLSLNNVDLILAGAIPAAVLAIVTELLFEALERWLLPRHLRLS